MPCRPLLLNTPRAASALQGLSGVMVGDQIDCMMILVLSIRIPLFENLKLDVGEASRRSNGVLRACMYMTLHRNKLS